MKRLLTLIVSLLVLSAVNAHADVMVAFEGVDPPIAVFEALTVGFAVEAETSGLRRTGAAQFRDLVITKLGGIESPTLFGFAAIGKGVPQITVAVDGNGEAVVIEMKNAQINKYVTETLTEGASQLIESISLTYEELCLSYGESTECYNALTSTR